MVGTNVDYENEALKLKSLLAVITGVDPNNERATAEIPNAILIAHDIAESIYCAIINKEV